MKTFLCFLVIELGIGHGGSLLAQSNYPRSAALNSVQGNITSLPPSNSVSHIATRDSMVWIGTSKGVARSIDGGRSWESFRSVAQFADDGIFSLVLHGDTTWTSTGFTKSVDGQDVQTGSGYTYSLDNDSTWHHIPQTRDAQSDTIVNYGSNAVRFLPVIVDEQNVTFDIALSDSFVWIASWSSGLRRSSNLGQSWQRIVLPNGQRNTIKPTDTLTNYNVDPRRDNNFLVFSVFVENNSTIWAGSAGGVNKSTDDGTSWTKSTTLNQVSHILGNWVIAIAAQHIDTTSRVWITDWKADLDPNEQFGVSYTDDGGRIWKNFLYGIKAYAFAFKGPVTYIATDEGIYRTDDGGLSWTRSGTIIDHTSRQRITSTSFFSVGVVGDTVYAGSGDGIAKTIDNTSHPFGESWEVLRTYRPVGNTATTYAYPNPFSPAEEAVRLHYNSGNGPATVTVEVFDFGMNRVKTVIKDATRAGSTEYDELWNGLNDSGNQVANGVYFYRVVVNGSEPAWGKILVLQ